MGYVLYREPVTKPQVLGFGLSLIGVIRIVFQGDWSQLLRLNANIGDLFMIVNLRKVIIESTTGMNLIKVNFLNGGQNHD